MQDEIPADYYGVHLHNGVPYLHQSPKGEGFDALGRGHASPFLARIKGKPNPPHFLDLFGQQPEKPPEGFLLNPLVDMYLPKPVFDPPPALAAVVCDGVMDYPYFLKLAALGCATGDQVRVWNPGQETKIWNDLRLTNLIPLTITGWGMGDAELHTLAASAYMQRRRFVAGLARYVAPPAAMPDFTPHFAVVKPVLDTMTPEYLRQVGSWFFRQYMIKLIEEQNDGNTPSPPPN